MPLCEKILTPHAANAVRSSPYLLHGGGSARIRAPVRHCSLNDVCYFEYSWSRVNRCIVLSCSWALIWYAMLCVHVIEQSSRRCYWPSASDSQATLPSTGWSASTRRGRLFTPASTWSHCCSAAATAAWRPQPESGYQSRSCSCLRFSSIPSALPSTTTWSSWTLYRLWYSFPPLFQLSDIFSPFAGSSSSHVRVGSEKGACPSSDQKLLCPEQIWPRQIACWLWPCFDSLSINRKQIWRPPFQYGCLFYIRCRCCVTGWKRMSDGVWKITVQSMLVGTTAPISDASLVSPEIYFACR